MEFALTKNQEKWQKIAREFVEKYIIPEVGRRDRIENAKDRIPWDWITEADKIGLRTLGISKKYGGEEADILTLCVVGEELAVGDLGFAVIMDQCWKMAHLFSDAMTTDQQEQFIPNFVSDPEATTAIGVTEPGAGSDLASLQCKAVREGDKYIINGTKIWTTHAHLANKIFCLVRTDNSGKKQEGITFLMLDMNQPGIKVEPILTMAQDHDFNQVVFTDAIADVKDRIGKENEGWSVAKYLLEFERSGGVGGSKSLSDIQFIKKLMNKISVTHNDTSFIDVYSTKVTELEIKAQSIQYTALRILSSLKGGDSPGPESSMMKTLVTDLEQEISEVTLEIIGYYGIPFQDTSLGSNEPAIGDESFRAIAGKYQNLRATTIYGGSNEIQRNIMAKAVLGL